MKNLKHQPTLKNDIGIKEISELSLGLAYREILATRYECHSPTKLNYFLLILSEGNTNTADAEGHAVPFQMQLYFPGQELHCKMEATTIIHEISLSLATFNAALANFKYPLSINRKYPSIPLERETFFKLVNELKSIHLEMELKNGSLEVIHSRLRIILLMISRELLKALPQGNHNQISQLKKFMDMVGKHCQDRHRVKFYADQLFMSANYLNILCKTHYQKTASEIIANELLEAAKRLLSSNGQSITVIAAELKFTDNASFSNFFKKHTGLSPKVFRDRLGG